MPKNIYKGYNPIYEAMASEQDPNKDKTPGADPSEIITAIYNYVINTLLIPSDQDNLKSIDGFNNLAKSLDTAQDFGGIKTTITNLANQLLTANKSLDDNGRAQYKEYLESLFNSLMQIPDVNSKLTDVKKVIDSLLDSTRDTIKKSASFKSANESILIEQHGYIKKKEITDDSNNGGGGNNDQSTNTDKSNDDTDYSGKWYVDLANSLLDQATAFRSETTPPSLDPKVAEDPQAKELIAKNTDFYNRALDLQVPGKRKGFLSLGKIKTRGGDMKGKDFQIACENLADEIKRTRDALNKIKANITKIPAPPVVKNCPSGFTWDSKQNKCIAVPKNSSNKGAGGTGSIQKGSDSQSNCTFPIPLSLKTCVEVKKLQTHLAQIPCVKEALNRKGGIDGKYGKVTSMICGVIYGHIKKDDHFPTNSPLTQEMYDALLKFNTGTKTNESAKNKLTKKIFEVECEKKEEVLKFGDFDNILEQVDTQSDLDFICKKISDKSKAIISVAGGGASKTNNKDNDSTHGSGNKTDENKDWQGLQPHKNQVLLISYDESLGSAWGKVAVVTAGTIIAVASAGTIAPALGAGAEAIGLGTAAGAEAAGGAAAADAAGAAATTELGADATIGVAKTVGKGIAGAVSGKVAKKVIAIGGATIASGGALSEFLSGRSALSVSIANNGFIRKNAIISMAAGASDSLDGFVSRKDITAIMGTLCALRGAWSQKDKKAVSAWSYFKEQFKVASGGSSLRDKLDFGTTTVRACENFPDFDTDDLSQGDTLKAEQAKQQLMDAVRKLDSNETIMENNIKIVTDTDIDNGIKSTTKSQIVSNSKDAAKDKDNDE